MKFTLKILSILPYTLYTLCAAESPGENTLTETPELVSMPTAPTPTHTPQFPDCKYLPESQKASSPERELGKTNPTSETGLLKFSTHLTTKMPVTPENSVASSSFTLHVAPSTEDAEAIKIQKEAIVGFITGFNSIMSKVKDTQGQNVHDLDPFMQQHIPTQLLKTLQNIHLGDNTLTKAQIIAILKEKAPTELSYENTKIPQEKVHQYIDSCVNQAFTQTQTQELFSRYVTILTDMDDQDYYNTLLNSIAENYATGGGCWPGVRNRCAISLAYLVAHKIDAL